MRKGIVFFVTLATLPIASCAEGIPTDPHHGARAIVRDTLHRGGACQSIAELNRWEKTMHARAKHPAAARGSGGNEGELCMDGSTDAFPPVTVLPIGFPRGQHAEQQREHHSYASFHRFLSSSTLSIDYS